MLCSQKRRDLSTQTTSPKHPLINFLWTDFVLNPLITIIWPPFFSDLLENCTMLLPEFLQLLFLVLIFFFLTELYCSHDSRVYITGTNQDFYPAKGCQQGSISQDYLGTLFSRYNNNYSVNIPRQSDGPSWNKTEFICCRELSTQLLVIHWIKQLLVIRWTQKKLLNVAGAIIIRYIFIELSRMAHGVWWTF